jgi:hypothetical protein
MNLVWIIGRFSLIAVALCTIGATIGCENPLSMLSMILSSQVQETSPDQVRVASKTELNDGTEARVGWAGSNSGVKPKAEDLAKDWEKPLFAMFVSGRQHGYIEPCGCTGLANQKGGLMRRHSAQKILLERGWDLVSIDAGNQVRRFGQQPTIKLGKTYESLCRVMGYSMIGIGADDLKIASIDLAQALLDAPQGDNPFTCANVEVVDASLSNRFVVIEKKGKRIGVTMILGDEHLNEVANSDVTVKPAAQGLKEVIPQLDAQRCDLKVLVAHTSLDNCRALAKQFPGFDLLVTAGGAGDPTLHPEVIEANGKVTSMIQVGVKGMYVGVVGVYEENGKASLKYERVPLDERFEDSPQVKEVFLNYQNELKNLWQSGQLADIKPRLHPSGKKFVGSAACADCHDEEYAIWEDGTDGDGGPHEKATRDLTDPGERSWVQRHFDPECVSCHVTGWNPQNYYPYVSGYQNLNEHVELHANGCENRHGPGSAHIDAENNQANNQGLLDKLREEMRLTLKEARESSCVQCHDLDNSPDFVKEGGFDEYWPKIEH